MSEWAGTPLDYILITDQSQSDWHQLKNEQSASITVLRWTLKSTKLLRATPKLLPMSHIPYKQLKALTTITSHKNIKQKSKGEPCGQNYLRRGDRTIVMHCHCICIKQNKHYKCSHQEIYISYRRCSLSMSSNMRMSVLIVNSLLFEIMNLFLFSETSHYFPLMMLISSWSLFWDMPDITIVTIFNSAI